VRDPPPIAELIPHQGGMCLHERIVAWDDAGVRVATASHRSPDNPLRRDGHLHAVHLCEYGAQAMAVHGGLLAWRDGGRAPPGMLVALRGVRFHERTVEHLPGELEVQARCLMADGGAQQYAFEVRHDGRMLCEGRATVMLRVATG